VSWGRAGLRWGLFGAALGLVLVAFDGISDPAWFVALLAVMSGLLGLFFHHRERLDTNEDAALERAASDPESLEQAVTWVQQLQNGERIRVGWFATLTPAGVEWSGLRTSSIRWDSVEHITPWTMSVRGGIRAGRGVRIRVPGKSMVISCSKSNFADVLATCAEMARSCS
jgi:hypothetical protein